MAQLLANIIDNWKAVNGIVFLVILFVGVVVAVFLVYRRIRSHLTITNQLESSAKASIRRKQYTEMLLEKTHAFLWTHSEGVFHMSKSLSDYFAWPTDTMTNAEMASLFIGSDYYLMKAHEFATLATPGEFVFQFYGQFRGHKPHWYEVRQHIDVTPRGIHRSGVAVVIDDVKRREAMELETRRVQAIAKESEDFIACMSHEIRTPLNAILGISQIFTDPNIQLTEDEVKMFSEEIDLNNILLMKMIEDMLTVTLMDNSNVQVLKSLLTPHSAREMLDRLMCEESVQMRHTKIVVDGGPDGASLMVDHRLFERVIINLVDNASKFSEVGSEVHIGWTTDGDDAIVYVADSGIGIPSEQQELIFGRFYKVDPFVQGAGLGLALARLIVEKMDGTIGVDSKPGKGSTFWVRFTNASKNPQA